MPMRNGPLSFNTDTSSSVLSLCNGVVAKVTVASEPETAVMSIALVDARTELPDPEVAETRFGSKPVYVTSFAPTLPHASVLRQEIISFASAVQQELKTGTP